MPEGDEVYLQFDGVNSSAKVYFNSKLLCTHHGGYSTFRVKLDDIKESNVIKVEVDNSPNDYVYPQQADFTFYGGIYRDVSLIGVSKNHFDLDYFGAPGIQITPVLQDEGTAKVNVKTYVKGAGEVQVTVNDETKTGNDVDFIFTVQKQSLLLTERLLTRCRQDSAYAHLRLTHRKDLS